MTLARAPTRRLVAEGFVNYLWLVRLWLLTVYRHPEARSTKYVPPVQAKGSRLKHLGHVRTAIG